MAQPTIFADSGLPTALVDNVRRFNPWWEDEAMPVQPPTRRHLVGQIRRRLDVNVAPIVVVRGPRQIGKTTAQFQIIQDLLREGVNPRRILRVQFDDLGTLKRLPEPILRISDWFERRIAPKRFNTLAEAGSPAYLFFDELQNLDGWTRSSSHWSTTLPSRWSLDQWRRRYMALTWRISRREGRTGRSISC